MKLGRLLLINLVVLLVLLVGAGIVYYFWYQNNHYVSTGNAAITVHQVMIPATTLATVSAVDVRPDQYVRKGEALMALSLPSGAVVDVTAPLPGTVLSTFAGQGDQVAPGTPLVAIGQLRTAEVVANIDETSIANVHRGQTVDITLPSHPADTYNGTVVDVGTATAASSSALLSANTSSTFEKQTQWVPVIIRFDGLPTGDLFPGFSANVRIHIR